MFQQNRTKNLLAKSEFVHAVQKERVRADRTKTIFSLIVFKKTNKSSDSRFRQLLKILQTRIREYDEAGQIKSDELAVLLPGAKSVGATVVAKDVCRHLQQASVSYIHQVYQYPDHWYSDSPLAGSHQAEGKPSLAKVLNTAPIWKRVFDIAICSVCMVLFTPVWVLVPLYIKLVSRGPVIFTQKRVGVNGKLFTIYKFRTMHPDRGYQAHQKHLTTLIQSNKTLEKLQADPRIIPFGRLLRKTAIDELPQMVNVLKGEMSIVGPRPCLPYEAELFSPWQRSRFDGLPGLTGLWQVSGKNKLKFLEMIQLDIRYQRYKNFWNDIIIILLTPKAVLDQLTDHFFPKQRASHAK